MWKVGNYKDKEKRKEYLVKWKEGHKESVRLHLRSWYFKKKREALFIIGRGELKCQRCGCSNYDLLEINHKNGDGHKERKKNKGGSGMIRAVIKGERSIEDLNLLCRPCNLVDAAERISGKKYILVL